MSAAIASSSHPHTMLDSPNHSYTDSNQSQELQEDQWRALAKIVRDVGPTLHPDEELGDLAAAEQAVNAKDAERAEVVDLLRDELRALTKQYNLASHAAQRPASHPTTAEHDAQVRSLEGEQYALGKQLNEEQAGVSKKEVELGRVKGEKEEVGRIQVGEEGYLNGKIIRLKMFAEAGFSILDKEGQQPKVLIRNDNKDDVHSVVADPARSKVNMANLIWSLASE
ncbi:hypothetical protein BCR39DRAFT_552234 [Naematelia encephala]|uniref:Kinetochore protein Spc24 n=1 Tax=Naematelia encephala TaxID=71784 RepID=A0A1Y2AI44_9TREE|nr:hypothetical protein BCR39DRAFT_552234 [Naematelia encephala]